MALDQAAMEIPDQAAMVPDQAAMVLDQAAMETLDQVDTAETKVDMGLIKDNQDKDTLNKPRNT